MAKRKNKLTTDKIKKMQQKYNKGWSINKIVEIYGFNRTTVLHSLDTDPTKSVVYKEGNYQKVRDMYFHEGKSMKDIAKEFGYSLNTVRRQFSHNDVKNVVVKGNRVLRGRKSKVDQEKKEAMQYMYDSGYSVAHIAMVYGIGMSTAYTYIHTILYNRSIEL